MREKDFEWIVTYSYDEGGGYPSKWVAGQIYVYAKSEKEAIKKAKKRLSQTANLDRAFIDAVVQFNAKPAVGSKIGDSRKTFAIADIIKKTDKGYVIYSEKGKRLSRPYSTREKAEERLKEIEMFKHMKSRDSYYKGYDIEFKGDLWQVWLDRHDGDKLVAGDFTSKEEAMEWIDAKKAQSSKSPKQSQPLKKYDVWYVDYDTDQSMVEKGVLARSADEARMIVKKKLGRSVYGYPHDVYLSDDMKENHMIEEVKKWLSKYLVKENDPENKIGKTHIRPLKPDEKLPLGVRHRAATDTSGIIHFKGGDYYWYLDGDEIHVERYITHDSIAKRFACESHFDKHGKDIEDSMETNDISKAKAWCESKLVKGYAPRVIDKLTGEIWFFDEGTEMEPAKIGDEKEPVHLWIVEWFSKNGVKFKGEFDSEEDAKEFISENEDENHNQMKIVEKDIMIGDAAAKPNLEKIKENALSVLREYAKKQGFEEDEIRDYINIHFSKGEDGGVVVSISNDLGIDYWDLPDDVSKKLEKAVGFIEPYSEYLWQAWLENASLEDSVPEKPAHEVKFITYTQFYVGFGDVEIKEDETFIEEFDTLEEAEEAAKEDMYGIRGQYVEVYVDGKFTRDYEVL